jgi:hypothetical protein
MGALALLFAFCWITVNAVVVPSIQWIAHEREEATSAVSLLARYRQLEASLPALEEQLDRLKASNDSKAFLQGKPPALMTAEMQSIAQRLVSTAGVTLRSSRTLPVTSEEGFDRASVELDMTASIAALTMLLHSVEASEPVLLVDRLVVRVPESGAVTNAAEGQPLLSVNVRLNSYALPAAKTRSP